MDFGFEQQVGWNTYLAKKIYFPLSPFSCFCVLGTGFEKALSKGFLKFSPFSTAGKSEIPEASQDEFSPSKKIPKKPPPTSKKNPFMEERKSFSHFRQIPSSIDFTLKGGNKSGLGSQIGKEVFFQIIFLHKKSVSLSASSPSESKKARK